MVSTRSDTKTPGNTNCSQISPSTVFFTLFIDFFQHRAKARVVIFKWYYFRQKYLENNQMFKNVFLKELNISQKAT